MVVDLLSGVLIGGGTISYFWILTSAYTKSRSKKVELHDRLCKECKPHFHDIYLYRDHKFPIPLK